MLCKSQKKFRLLRALIFIAKLMKFIMRTLVVLKFEFVLKYASFFLFQKNDEKDANKPVSPTSGTK